MRKVTDIPSVAADVHKWVKGQPPGTVFFQQDVEVAGSDVAIRQALSRLAKEGEVLRVTNGIYATPKHSTLLGPLRPSLEDIAHAIARRDKVQLQPTGALALNALGLSTQVPMRVVYLTDGSPRKIRIGPKAVIEFRKRSPRRVAQKSNLMALLIAALEELGPEEITLAVRTKIKDALSQEESKIIHEDALTAPAWIRMLIRELNPHISS